MDRRDFIKLSCASLGLLLIPEELQYSGVSKKTPELKLLSDFMDDSNQKPVTKDLIENILYDIYHVGNDGSFTQGRATQIGDDYFITAYHVVNEKLSELRLVPQSRRGYLLDFRREFQILEHDEKTDLALLKAEETNSSVGEAKINLSSKTTSIDDKVSTFIRLTGNPPKERYEFTYSGIDFYDTSKTVEDLGKLILPANSLLFEKEGHILRYDEEFLNKIKGNHSGSSKYERFTSVGSYNGESGQPMFLKISENRFLFTGILTAGYLTKHTISAPNHPFGHDVAIRQSGAFFAHDDSVRQLINKYIQKTLLKTSS